MKIPTVYIMANKRNGTIYTGMTTHLAKRSYEHRNGVVKGFTLKYGCKLLVYYEIFETIEEAVMREHQIKAMGRKNKLNLIEKMNPNWLDLYDEICI